MKKSWLLTALGCLLLFAACFLVVRCPRTVPLRQCSELYQRYAKTPGIDASFIKDFRVNDSVTLDVTLLEARDSAGWATLKHDFAVPDLNAELQQISNSRKDLVFTRRISHDNYSSAASSDTTIHDLLATSHYYHTLTIFHITNNDEKQAVYYHNFNESINSK